MAAELVTRLDPRQLAAVLADQSAGTATSEAERQATLREFARLNRSQGPPQRRAAAEARRASSTRPFQFLQNIDAATVAAILAGEHPQTIALVIWHLPSERGASIVARLGDEHQSSVRARVASMAPPNPHVVRDVADVLAAQILGLADQRRSA
jgi:flagellar motor switch protein FliG